MRTTAFYITACLFILPLLGGCLGQTDSAGRSVTNMVFGCLQDEDGEGDKGNVVYNASTETLSFTWALAKKGHGTITYKIYEMKSGDLLKTTTDNQWDLKLRSDSTDVYVFAVEASDLDGETTCREHGGLGVGAKEGDGYVTVALNKNVGAPDMGKTWAFPAAHNRVLLVWEKSTSPQVARYDVFPYENLFTNNGFDIKDPTPVANTVKNYIFMDGLSPASTYRFIVEAVNSAGIRSKRRQDVTVTTLSTDRPMFNGTFQVNKVGGLRGLDSLDLRLSPSVDTTVTGYRVFMYQGDLDYDMPFSLYQQVVPENSIFSDSAGYYIPRLVGGLPVETIRVSALAADTNYCFVLRAFRGGVVGNPVVVEDENNLRVCQKTNYVKAPTFLGVATAKPADGAAGFGAIQVSYPSPESDGVWTKFKIKYKSMGTTDPGVGCPGVSMAGAFSKFSNDDQDFSVPITASINPLEYYCVQVNTVYDIAPFNVSDTNTKLVRVIARPDPPSFNGIIAVTRTPSAFGEMFDSVDIYHANATGSFSKYRYEIATSSSFALNTIVKTDEEVQRETSKRTISGLPKKTQLYARVIAQFDGPEINGEVITLTDVMDTVPARTPKFLGINTTPSAPANDGVKQITIVNPITLEIEGQLATNPGATWSENVFWLVEEGKVPKPGGGFYTPEDAIQLYKDPSGILDPYIVPQSSPTRTTTKVQVTGLDSNKRYCAMFRSKFDLGGDKLDSASGLFDTSKYCATPELRAASFSGITALYNRNDAAGFGQIWAKFPKLPSAASFSRYRTSFAVSPDGTTQPPINFPSDADHVQPVPTSPYSPPLESYDAAAVPCTIQSTSCCVKNDAKSGAPYIHCPVGPSVDVPKNRTYFAKTVVEFEFGGKAADRTGTSAIGSARTTPALPSAPSISAKSGGSTSIQLSVVASEDPNAADPNNPDALRGLWNNVFIYLATDDATAQALLSKGTYNADLKSYVPSDSDIAYVANGKGEWEIAQGDQEPPVGCTTDCRTNVEKGMILRAERKSGTQGVVENAPNKTTLYIRNLQPLTGGNNYKMRARVVYWNGTKDEYVQSSEVSAQANPQGGAPQFLGVGSLEKFHNQDDFTKIKVIVTKPVGECTRLEALVYPKAYDASYTAADWNNSAQVEVRDCDQGNEGDTEALIFDKSFNQDALIPGAEYYVRVRAVNQVINTLYTAGQDVRSFVNVMQPDRPSLVTVQPLNYTSVTGGADTLSLPFLAPASGDFNRIMIFRNEGTYTGDSSTDSTTTTNLKTALKNKMKTVKVGAAVGPDAQINNSGEVVKMFQGAELAAPGGSMQYSFTQALAGKIYCFGVLAMYSGTSTFINDQYLSSLPPLGSSEDLSGVTISCKTLNFNPPFSPISIGDGAIVAQHMTGTPCTNAAGAGTYPIKLTLPAAALANSNIEKWQVFAVSDDDYDTTLASFGDLNAEAWEEIPWGSTSTGPELGDFSTSGYLMVGCKGKTIGGKTRFFVRWQLPGSAVNDTSTTRISNALTIPTSQSNYTWVSKKTNGLSYSYLMGTFEASKISGTASGESTPSEASMVNCNTGYHSSGSLSSCGTGSDVVVGAMKSKVPMTANWTSAWWACRQTGLSGVLTRLPTEVEWRRAALWAGDQYSSIESNYDVDCDTHTGSIGVTGGNANCKGYYGIYDMAGRAREWVDARMVAYQVVELRNSWGPTIGRVIDNGIDRLTSRFHEITPPSNGLGLLMGSDFSTSANLQVQIDAETQYWADLTLSNASNGTSPITGFRCMGFLKTQIPSASQLSLPQEPPYLAADIQGSVANWTVPEGRFAKDTRPENVQVIVTNEATPSGKIQISWKPWSKGAGSSPITYDLYRIIEPTHFDARFGNGWALPSSITASPYATAKPLDPLAVNSNGSATWTVEKIASDMTSSEQTCTSTTAGAFDSAMGTTNDSTIKVPYTLNGQTIQAPSAPCHELDYGATDAKRMYMYILVAKDGHGNRMPPMVQRFRTPYLAGDYSTGARASFRHEMRWRRASIGAVAEAYQEGKSVPQTMAYVPMDQSGHDHDYYIQKYEAWKAVGTSFGNNGPTLSNFPVAAGTGGVWSYKIGACTAANDREPSVFGSDCGSMSTNVKLGSKFNVTPVGSGSGSANATSYASLWQGCRLSSIDVTEGATTYSYTLHSQTGAEFTKAGDWGDMDFDDHPDHNPYLTAGTSISAVEFSADGLPDGQGNPTACYTEGASSVTASHSTGSRASCISRYGVVDLVGNVSEYTSERGFVPSATTKRFLDNGTDGLWLGMRDSDNFDSRPLNGVAIDLIRGLPMLAVSLSGVDGAIISNLRGNTYTSLYNTDTGGVALGGSYKEQWVTGSGNGKGMGRFSRSTAGLDTATDYMPQNQVIQFGGRCAR